MAAPIATARDEAARGIRASTGTSWWWLAAVALLLPFANGHNTIAIVAWLAPVFVMRFLRAGRVWRFVAAWPRTPSSCSVPMAGSCGGS